MKSSINSLFEKIKSSDETTQNNATAQLWMLLEKSLFPEREDETWKMVLSDDLFQLKLTAEEVKEVIDYAIFLVEEAPGLCRSLKIPLIQIIVLTGRVESAEAIFQFLFKYADSFSEQEAFSFISNLTQYCLRIGDLSQITFVIEKYKAVQILNNLQNLKSKRLQESIRRTLLLIS